MGVFNYNDKEYEVDVKSFLVDINQWESNFVQGMALQLGIPTLTTEHWNIVNYIHNTYIETGRCPRVYQTCETAGLRLQELRRLFPTGYLRGACKIAGIPSKAGHLGLKYQEHAIMEGEDPYFMGVYDKTYTVDVRGFLVNPEEWDEYYAVYKAYDMKINSEGKLTDKHWAIIDYLRKQYKKDKNVPTIYETCEANQIDIPELEKLFPDGYHRGAVKIAGLRI